MNRYKKPQGTSSFDHRVTILDIMKRPLLMMASRGGHKIHLAVILLFVYAVYLFTSTYMASSTPKKTVVTIVKKYRNSPTDSANPNRVYYVNLTYYEANPKYKITHFTDDSPSCFGEACMLNRERKEIEVMPVRRSQCVPISRCVTVNIKTRHRYTEVKEFIDSIHKYYPALKVVVLDEFNPKYEDTEWAKTVANSPLITYIQAHPGVGYGRKMAAMTSETPYVLVADDDYLFSDKTNVAKLVEVLENSDADIAAGTTDDSFPFAGAVRVSTEDSKVLLSLYPGIYYNVIPNYKNCYQADIVKTFFLAKRESILHAGSWDPSRPFYEHEDFFFQMRKSRIKIAYCDDVIVKHVARTRDLANLRAKSFDEMKALLLEKWKIDDYFSCTIPMSYSDKQTCPEAKRKHFH